MHLYGKSSTEPTEEVGGVITIAIPAPLNMRDATLPQTSVVIAESGIDVSWGKREFETLHCPGTELLNYF